jgi:hypothetical protein
LPNRFSVEKDAICSCNLFWESEAPAEPSWQRLDSGLALHKSLD